MPHSETYIDGVYYPSVTTILGAQPKPWLDNWFVKWGTLATRKVSICSSLGHEFHRCVEEWLDKRAYAVSVPVDEDTGQAFPSLVPRIQGMMRSWVAWANGIDGLILFTEIKVVSHKHRYSGTFDALADIEKRLWIVDWKTSSNIYPEMGLQLAAYVEASNELKLVPTRTIKDGMIVHVSKDKPHFKVKTKEFLCGKRAFSKFLKLREMFDDLKGLDKPEE